jgi:hypothetical protein
MACKLGGAVDVPASLFLLCIRIAEILPWEYLVIILGGHPPPGYILALGIYTLCGQGANYPTFNVSCASTACIEPQP